MVEAGPLASKLSLIKYIRRLIEELLGLTFRFGIETAASFTGTPKTKAVLFSTPFDDTTYALAFGVRTTDSRTAFIPTFTNKTTTGFTLNLNTDSTTNLVEVCWEAIKL